MGQVYVEAALDGTDSIRVNLETLLVINVYHICDTDDRLKLNVAAKRDSDEGDPLFPLDLSGVEHEIISEAPELVRCCVWPVVTTGNVIIAGLCSVSRQIIKCCCEDDELRRLLGFKESCLLACSENSVWTRFCEVELPTAVKRVLLHSDEYVDDDECVRVPTALTKFERHMRQPVRTHNVYKLARERHNDRTIKSSVPVEQLNLAHGYGEGPFMTLADVLLFPCFQIYHRVFGCDSIESELPLSTAWSERMRLSGLRWVRFELPSPLVNMKGHRVKLDGPSSGGDESLYLSDPNRRRPQSRVYTRQIDVDNSMNVVSKLGFEVGNDPEPFGYELEEFDWAGLPLPALPQKRADRKREQLENLAKAVIKLVGRREHVVIVDFCSGSGHLGILLATLLPNCRVILVENKERSLFRAEERISQLSLKNVALLQCNLDYFRAKFDVGVSLHACGVATDLVIQNCIKNGAHFVCCPCCYGGIHDCHRVTYPRSKEFLDSKMTHKDYLSVAHAADQTHDGDNVKTKQGYVCMDIIDTDRKLQAESCDYVVHLGKLRPTTCTPKNNLLVGVCKTSN